MWLSSVILWERGCPQPHSFLDHLAVAAPSLLPMLLDAAIKGVAILALTALATLAMRRSSAAARHLVWFLGTLSLLILPILSAALPGWYILPRWTINTPTTTQQPIALPPLPPGDEGQQVPPVPSPAVFVPAQADSASAPPLRASVPSSLRAFSSPLPWQAWTLLTWLAGTILLLAHVTLGFLSLWWLGHRSSRITDGHWPILLRQLSGQLGLRRPVELLTSPRRTMPMTWGLWRTRLLLPEDSATWTPDQRRAVLLHELAHARRWDCLTQLAVQIACALYWFNPLVWLAWHRIQNERERACDDLVLSAGTKASAYAEQLLHIASDMPAVRFSAAAIAMARPSSLEGRLLAILDVKRSRRALTWGAVALVVLMIGAFAVPLSILRAADARKPEPTKENQPATLVTSTVSAEVTSFEPVQNGPTTTYRWRVAPKQPQRLMSSLCTIRDGNIAGLVSNGTGQHIITEPQELELAVTSDDKEVSYEFTRHDPDGKVTITSTYPVPPPTPHMQTLLRMVPRTAPTAVTGDAKLILWSGRWVRSDLSVADELALAVSVAPPEQAGYFLGGQHDPVTAIEPIATLRRFPNAKLLINNRRYGDNNGLTGSLDGTTSAQCGHPGAVSDLSGRFLRSTREGDVYEFTRKFPIDAKDPADVKTITKTITYAGKSLTVFEDEIQRIVIFPPPVSSTQPATDAARVTQPATLPGSHRDLPRHRSDARARGSDLER